MIRPRVLVLAGDGINCERETAGAFVAAGAAPKIATLNQIAQNPARYREVQVVAFPGGFSFGDELGSGRILALKIKYLLGEWLDNIASRDQLAIGICNGFQALVQLGLLPEMGAERSVTLSFNTSAEGMPRPFINRWVKLQVVPSPCVWTRNCPAQLSLPIRHGEGRVQFLVNRERALFEQLRLRQQIPLYYRDNINGSEQNIAGLCDRSGRIFGLMPHPEAATDRILEPGSTLCGVGSGMQFFINAVEYFK